MLYDITAYIAQTIKMDEDQNQWLNLGLILSAFDEYGINLWKQFSRIYEQYLNIFDVYDNEIQFLNQSDCWHFGSLLSWLKEYHLNYYKILWNENCKLIKSLDYDENNMNIFRSDKLYMRDVYGYIEIYYEYYNKYLVCTSQKKKYFFYIIVNLVYGKKKQLMMHLNISYRI